MSGNKWEPSQVLLNAIKDPAYCPYCLRCRSNVRMVKVAPFLWGCLCGAVHDERSNAKRYEHNHSKK